MTIEIFRIREGKPAQAVVPLPDEGLQTVVSCQGDIAVLTYGPDENTHGVHQLEDALVLLGGGVGPAHFSWVDSRAGGRAARR